MGLDHSKNEAVVKVTTTRFGELEVKRNDAVHFKETPRREPQKVFIVDR